MRSVWQLNGILDQYRSILFGADGVYFVFGSFLRKQTDLEFVCELNTTELAYLGVDGLNTNVSFGYEICMERHKMVWTR